MKPIFIVTILLGLSLNIFSQTTEEETKSKHFEIGVNASSFVKNFIGLGNDSEISSSINPYIFHFKLVNNNKAFRAHLGFNSAISQIETNSFRESNIIIGNFKIGYEQRTMASKRWMVLYGVDALLNIQLIKSSSVSFEEVDIRRQEFQFGLSPFIGFAFNLTPKIYISTEASLEGLYTTTKDKTIFNDPSVPDQTDSSNAFRLTTKLPNNLNFTVKF